MQLSDVGSRICILGPSNSGKSTLAVAIARKAGLEPVHLDQLCHMPGTDWAVRPEAEFQALHDAAIERDRWVIDGNYSRYLQQRLDRATGLILLDISTPRSLIRYVRRTLFERDRKGGLAGGKDSLKWDMVRHITMVNPKGRERARGIYAASPLPKIALMSARAVSDVYARWGLERP